MKIYLDNYNPSLLKNKLTLFEKYNICSNKLIEVISEDGLYITDYKEIFKINVSHDETSKMEFNGFSFIIDKSIIHLEKVYLVPTHNHLSNIHKYTYKSSIASKISFIIEGEMNNNNFVPTNFYFEAPNNQDLTVCKEDLNVFLSLLN